MLWLKSKHLGLQLNHFPCFNWGKRSKELLGPRLVDHSSKKGSVCLILFPEGFASQWMLLSRLAMSGWHQVKQRNLWNSNKWSLWLHFIARMVKLTVRARNLIFFGLYISGPTLFRNFLLYGYVVGHMTLDDFLLTDPLRIAHQLVYNWLAN